MENVSLAPEPITLTPIVTSPIRVRCSVCGDRFLAQRRSRKTCSDTCRQTLSRRQRAATPPLPEGPFDLILADPPWRWQAYSAKGEAKSPSKHYSTMTTDQICRLPVERLCAKNCGLALWVYGPMLPAALEVMQAWGFTFKSELLTWMKCTNDGKGMAFGNGYTTRKHVEQVFYGTRGKGIQIVHKGVRQGFLAPKGAHSQKPEESYLRIERLFGPVRRLELFARHERQDWTAWGNQIPYPQP